MDTPKDSKEDEQQAPALRDQLAAIAKIIKEGQDQPEKAAALQSAGGELFNLLPQLDYIPKKIRPRVYCIATL